MTASTSTFSVCAIVGIAAALLTSTASAQDNAASGKLVIHADQPGATIDRNIYGQFSEHLGHGIYEGLWVGDDATIPNTRGIRNDVVNALKHIKLPVLRWPGGCFADEYHWMDGIGPRDNRPTMINTHWGGVTENNAFGTHEFMDLCEQLDCQPYICGNMGSGTVREMQEWVEYMTFDGVSPMAELRKKNGHEKPWKLTWFGVGNENWGCGGNMRPEYYSDQFRRYGTYVRNFGGNHIFKIACGPNGSDYHWTEVMMRDAGSQLNGLALHYYCGSGKNSRSATKFNEIDWFFQLKNALYMEELVVKHSEIMDRYDAKKRVALVVDEWGAWHAVEPDTNPGFLYQQNSLRDALVAGVTLNIFNRHCDRVKMANIAQTINVLQSMVLTQKEKMVLTPTYHVFEMYAVHQDATLLPAELETGEYTFEQNKIPGLSVSASKDKAGKVHITLCNLNPNTPARIACQLRGAKAIGLTGRVLTAETMQAHNTFDAPENVKPSEFKAFETTDDGFTTTVPAKSVVALEL